MNWLFGRDTDATFSWNGDPSLNGHKKHVKAYVENMRIIRERMENYAFQLIKMAEAGEQLSDCLSQFYGESRAKSSKERSEAFADANDGMLTHASAQFGKIFNREILNELDDMCQDAERVQVEIRNTEAAHKSFSETKHHVDILLERKAKEDEGFREAKQLEDCNKEMIRRSTYYEQIRRGVDTTTKSQLSHRFHSMDKLLVRLMEMQFSFFAAGYGTYSEFKEHTQRYRQRENKAKAQSDLSGGWISKGGSVPMDDENVDFREVLKTEPVLIMPFTRIENIHMAGSVDEAYFTNPHQQSTGRSVTSTPSSAAQQPSRVDTESPVANAASPSGVPTVFKIEVWTKPFGLTFNRRGEVTRVETHAAMVGVQLGDKVIAINDHFINPKKFGVIAKETKVPYFLTLRREPPGAPAGAQSTISQPTINLGRQAVLTTRQRSQRTPDGRWEY
mmetsp:Transcript_2147/g.4287  ORF Transcript_2147/g.4287 Transcript_2147/m.4287 type:complete len:447 (-) Transcript_2147:14-1354(-)